MFDKSSKNSPSSHTKSIRMGIEKHCSNMVGYQFLCCSGNSIGDSVGVGATKYTVGINERNFAEHRFDRINLCRNIVIGYWCALAD